MRKLIVVLAGLILSATSLRAETSYPMLMSLKPAAAQVGQTSEHTVNSRYSLLGAYQVIVTGAGVTGEVVPPELKPEELEKKPNLTALKVKFTVAPDAESGVRDFRIATPRGVSTVGQLVVTREPVVAEAKDNNQADQAQMVTLPATLCGAIEKAEDVDWYRFHIDQPGNFVFHARCGRLQDRIHDLQAHADPLLTLKSADGRVLAVSDNHFYADPLIATRLEQPGDYLLEVRDVRYEGNQYWEYCIEASTRPFVETVYPLGLARGQQAALELVGHFLPAAPAPYSIAADAPLGRQMLRLPLEGDQTNPVAAIVTDLPLVLEAGENNEPDKAQMVTAPCGINGRIETESDLDCYSFAAKKGERYSFEVIARRLQSSLDSQIRILDAKGKMLASNDDLRHGKRGSADSWLEFWSPPADGNYVVEIRDVHLRGGAAYPYFLQITRSEPYFDLFLDTDKTQIALGTSGVLFARVERKNGFTGEVKLNVEDLPEGVTASCGRILEGKPLDGCIIFTAAEGTKPCIANIRVTGTGEVTLADGTKQSLTVAAQPYQETYQPGGGRGHWPVDTHTISVNEPWEVRAVKLSEYDITLKPGESKKIEITIERDPEFKSNVTLDILFQHLASAFANTLPPGVTVNDKDVKTLLSNGATQGHITLKAADDAAPVEKQQCCIMANVSINFVMKATYSSAPLTISVVK
jgi:hypothetical protein